MSLTKVTYSMINGSFVNVLDFGADPTGSVSSSSAIQNAINTGYSVYIPAGSYLLNTSLSFSTSPAGYNKGIRIFGDGAHSTVLINEVASGYAMNFRQTVSFAFQEMSSIKSLSISTNTAPASSGGITFSGSLMMNIEDVKITGLTGDGINIYSNVGTGDNDQNTLFTIRRVHISDCGGYAINMDYTPSASAANYTIENCLFRSCYGGINAVAANSRISECGFVLSSTAPQLKIRRTSVSPYCFEIKDNFFEKGRAGELEIDGGKAFSIARNTFASNDVSSGPFAIRLGENYPTSFGYLSENRFIVEASISPSFTCIDFGPHATAIETTPIIDDGINSSTKYAFDASATSCFVTGVSSVTTTQAGAAVTWTPNLVQPLQVNKLIMSYAGASTLTVNAPTFFGNNGQICTLQIQDTTGGTTVTWGTGTEFRGGFGTTIGSSAVALISMVYDGGSNAWRLISQINIS